MSGNRAYPEFEAPESPESIVTAELTDAEREAASKDLPVVDASGRKLTKKQREANVLLQGPQRHTALVGGARAGKTVLFLRAVVVRSLRFNGLRSAVLRLNSNAIWPSIGMDTFPWVMANLFPGITYETHSADGYFELPGNGAQIWLGGLGDAKQVDKILGREYGTIFFNECSQIPYLSVLTALSRLAQKLPGMKQRAYYDLNPTGKGHWTNVQFGEKRNPVSKLPLPNPEEYARLFVNPADNEPNLTPEFLESLKSMPIRQRKRFYEGVYVDETENALWTFDMIERGRVDQRLVKLPDMLRIVIAVDPSGARNQFDIKRDMIGIVAMGLGVNREGYVLDDRTRHASPKGWARAAIGLYLELRADCIVAEVNYGGAMVESVIKTEAEDMGVQVLVKVVTASRGKVVRAEPVSALYGDPEDPLKPTRVHHVGMFTELEEEMSGFTDLGYVGERSPNRVDALVWAATELMLTETATAWLGYVEGEAAKAKGQPPPGPRTQRIERVELMAPAPQQAYQPTKDRRYVSDVSCRIYELTGAGMILGALPEDVAALSIHGCTPP